MRSLAESTAPTPTTTRPSSKSAETKNRASHANTTTPSRNQQKKGEEDDERKRMRLGTLATRFFKVFFLFRTKNARKQAVRCFAFAEQADSLSLLCVCFTHTSLEFFILCGQLQDQLTAIPSLYLFSHVKYQGHRYCVFVFLIIRSTTGVFLFA